MTTATKAASQPISIDFTEYANRFAEWKHPNDVAAQKICKYNMMATGANSALVATIASFALACFSNFMILGLALTAGLGLLYLGFSAAANNGRKFLELTDKDTWTPVLVQLNGLPVLYRCYSAPKPDAPKTEQKQSVPAKADALD